MGTQNVYIDGGRPAAVAVSVAPPFGQRDEARPVRGRAGVLADLADDDTAPAGVRILHGLGGCGKTRLALEAAFAAQEAGAQVWWVSAADPGVLEAGMHAVGRRLGLAQADLEHGDAADLIWQRLAACPQRWMLVLDNADDPPILAGPGASVREGRGWLRPVTGQAGTVLVTSRDGAGATWGPWCRRLPLGMLPADQAAEVLADYARRRSGLGDEQDARALAERLGGLPLALKIAGSYLAESVAVPAAFAEPGTISTYRQYLDALQAGEFARLFPLPGTGLTQEQARSLIGATWDLTLDRLDARQMPEARHLLRLLATFADAPIPHELLLDPALLAAASPQLPGITGPQLWQTLTVLDGFGLVTLAPAGPDTALLPTVRLHPLVRDASRPPAGSRDQLDNLALAALLLARATAAPETGSPDDPSKQPAWQLLTPHASQVFSELTARTDSPGEAVIVAASAVQLTAQYRAGQGYHAAAEAEYRDVLAAKLPILGPDHPSTLTTRHQIAMEMSGRGDYAGAEAENRGILAVELRILGPDHPSTLATRHQIAMEMSGQGDYAGAEAEFRTALAGRLRVLGPDHSSTLVTQRNLEIVTKLRSDSQRGRQRR